MLISFSYSWGYSVSIRTSISKSNFHQIFSSIPIDNSYRNSFINSGGSLYVWVGVRSLLRVHFVFFFNRTYCNCLVSTECPAVAHFRHSCGTCDFCLSAYLYFVDGLVWSGLVWLPVCGYKATNCSNTGRFCNIRLLCEVGFEVVWDKSDKNLKVVLYPL